MVAPAKIARNAKDILLAPIYLYQGIKVKRDTVRLPEPEGERQGQMHLGNATQATRALHLMLVGDSAAAGVGSETQSDALIGQLIPALTLHEVVKARYGAIDWSLQATTGHTSFDILRRLYVLPVPAEPIDVMVLSVGVNDTTTNISKRKWRERIEAIIAIAQRKFGVTTLIFSSLPPMANMPALPAPLNGFIGAIATGLDDVLQDICAQHEGVHYMEADFARMAEAYHSDKHGNGAPIDSTLMFASDGFHPSPITYRFWALQLAEMIDGLLNADS